MPNVFGYMVYAYVFLHVLHSYIEIVFMYIKPVYKLQNMEKPNKTYVAKKCIYFSLFCMDVFKTWKNLTKQVWL